MVSGHFEFSLVARCPEDGEKKLFSLLAGMFVLINLKRGCRRGGEGEEMASISSAGLLAFLKVAPSGITEWRGTNAVEFLLVQTLPDGMHGERLVKQK